MSAQLLATELHNLITESKRKHQDLRQVRGSRLSDAHTCTAIWLTSTAQAAEKSLEELKGIRVSEAQFGRGENH
jgi:hypothetical protein